MKNKVITAVPSPASKRYMDADDELGRLEDQLDAAASEVLRLTRAVVKQRRQVGEAFGAAIEADGGIRRG